MSETSKTTSTKTGSTKSTANTGAKTVGANTATKPTKAQQDALNTAATMQGKGNETLQTKTPTDGAGDGVVAGIDSLGILGAFKVRAKSDQGFWRSGVQFLRKKETIVLVVDEEPEDQPAVVAQEGIESELILFMSKEKAERVHREPNLVVEDVDVSDVIEVE
ncbi:hypothetical protein I6Z03_002985 [Vibrio parahaemolyticus]|nr:hypothetical protein [Vibrio parahaemolyticus]